MKRRHANLGLKYHHLSAIKASHIVYQGATRVQFPESSTLAQAVAPARPGAMALMGA